MKRIVFVSLLFAIAFSACNERKTESVLDAVPLNSALTIETGSSSEMLSDLQPFFATADVLQSFYDNWTMLDSLIPVFHQSDVAWTLLAMEGGYKPVVVVKSPKRFSSKELKNQLEQNGMQYEEMAMGKTGLCLLPDIDSLLVFVHKGYAVAGRDVQALQQVLTQIDAPVKIYDNAVFAKVQATLGTAVRSHLYMNYDLLENALAKGSALKYERAIDNLIQHFGGIASFDVLLKENGVVLNGYSIPCDSAEILKPLKYQTPVRNSIVNVLPFNTRMMLHFGMSDYLSYWEEQGRNENVGKLNKRYSVKIEEQLLNNLSEVSCCFSGTASKPVFVARMSNPAEVIQFWTKLISKTGASFTEIVQGYSLYQVNVSDFVPTVFGENFNTLKNCCYSIVDQYLIVADDFEDIRNVIACYRSGRTLDLNQNFKEFQNNMLESANITFYVECAGNQQVANYLGGKAASFFQKNQDFLSSYQALSIQFAASKDLVYTTAYLRKQTGMKEETNVQWKVNLDAPLQGTPCIVPDAASDRSNLVVFDADNTMYLIDAEGKILWKKSLSESPMSDVFTVDSQNDGETQFLFNTARYLYLIDAKGNNMADYPRKLLAEASNGLTVTDYENTLDYRVLICGKDKFVYNYDLQGGETEGWNRHRTDEVVTKPVQHLVADNKDFLVVTDIKGGVRILDRQGRMRIPLSGDLHKAPQADFYQNRTNHKGIILTSDETGKLLYVKLDGGLARTDFGDYSALHFFLYEDFNGDQDPDFIYLDNGELKVFDRFKKVLFSHNFDAEIRTRPVFFNITRNKRLLGVVSKKSREIYLFDKKGNMITSSGLVGETPFAVGSLMNNNQINLITGVGNSLFNYLIY